MHRRHFADVWQAELGVPVEAVVDPEIATRGAGLVVLMTSATAPVVEDAWVTTLAGENGGFRRCEPTCRRLRVV